MIDAARIGYKPGWRFEVTDKAHFAIVNPTLDSDTGDAKEITHVFGIPPEPPAEGWYRWVLDRVLDVETHEAREFFAVGDRKPFYPPHGSQGDPYILEHP